VGEGARFAGWRVGVGDFIFAAGAGRPVGWCCAVVVVVVVDGGGSRRPDREHEHEATHSSGGRPQRRKEEARVRVTTPGGGASPALTQWHLSLPRREKGRPHKSVVPIPILGESWQCDLQARSAVLSGLSLPLKESLRPDMTNSEGSFFT
jgi:hypothetical protein